jgi:DNA-binding response OmpR family regulator
MRVLLLDGNQEFCEFLATVLIENGVEAVATSTVEDALAKFGQEKYDGLVVNSLVDKLDAIEIAERVRATPAGKNVPVLLMSVITTSLARRVAKAANCQFIAKPFGMTEFVEQVRALR